MKKNETTMTALALGALGLYLLSRPKANAEPPVVEEPVIDQDQQIVEDQTDIKETSSDQSLSVYSIQAETTYKTNKGERMNLYFGVSNPFQTSTYILGLKGALYYGTTKIADVAFNQKLIDASGSVLKVTLLINYNQAGFSINLLGKLIDGSWLKDAYFKGTLFTEGVQRSFKRHLEPYDQRINGLPSGLLNMPNSI